MPALRRPYCEDCAHYQAHSNPVLSKCMRDRSEDVGPLNMVVRNVPVGAARECMTERGIDSFCGPMAKYFQPRLA